MDGNTWYVQSATPSIAFFLSFSCFKNNTLRKKLARPALNSLFSLLYMEQLIAIFDHAELLECVSVGATFTNREHIRAWIDANTAARQKKNVSWAALLPHQIEGVRWMETRENDISNAGGILADEMGLGKTVTVLANIHYHDPTTTLVVCPAGVVGHWIHEIGRWMPGTSYFHYTGGVQYNRSICIVSYSMLLRDHPAGWLFSQTWGRVVLDEAHMIRNQKKTFAACMSIRSPRRWVLSGTPVQNRPADFDALIAFVCSNEGRGRSISKATKRKRVEQNKRNTLEPQSMYLRREIKNTVSLPQKFSETVLVPWANAEEKARYSRLFGEVVDHVKRHRFEAQVLVYLNNLRFFCSTSIMPRMDITTVEDEDDEVDIPFDTHIMSSKMRAVLELYERIPRNEKIVIFSQWLHVLSVLERHIPQTVRYDGRMSYEAKEQALDAFTNNESIRVILTSLKAGNAGINLSVASRVIIVDPWWNPGVEKQAEDRVYRIGQIRPVFVYRLIIGGSIEQQIHDMKESKSRRCETFFDEMQNVYTELLTDPLLPTDNEDEDDEDDDNENSSMLSESIKNT